MSLPKMTTAVDNISKLDTRPNAVNGLTADELKAKFDKAPEDIKRFLNEVLIPALDGAITPDALGAVPETRRVNGKTLAADITISAEDIPALAPDLSKKTAQYLLDELADGASKAVPKTRKVNGKPLDEDIALAAEDVGYSKTVGGVTVDGTVKTELKSLNAEMGRKVPTTRKVNGKTLDADVTLDAASIDYAGAISGAANVKAALDAITANLSGLTAEDVQYQGNIGAAQVFSVAEALDGLAVGVPMDMSANYAASGAASVQAWATMTKTGDETKYRVAAGRYSISDADGEIGYLITIIDTPGVTCRTVWVASVTDGYAFVDCYTTSHTGGAVEHVVEFDAETNFLEINGHLVTLPAYTAADAGKNLTIGTDGTPSWKAAAALPTVGTADNGKFLRVVSGAWAAQALTNVAEVGA